MGFWGWGNRVRVKNLRVILGNFLNVCNKYFLELKIFDLGREKKFIRL